MKIAYNDDGTITTVALNSQEVVGEHVATVPDDLDVFTYPAKYKYINSVFVLAPRLEATASALVATVGTTILVTVRARALGGALDLSSTAPVIVQHGTGVVTPGEFSLVEGAATFEVTDATPEQVFVFPYSDGMYSEPVIIQFVAA